MRVVVAADHAGFSLKEYLATELKSMGCEVVDVSPGPPEPGDDYPDSALALGRALRTGEADRGVLICGSGVGASVAANKVKGIRAAVCHDAYSAHQGVEHDDMNVLVLGARVIGVELAHDLVRNFIGATFSGESRHVRRLGKIRAMEDRF